MLFKSGYIPTDLNDKDYHLFTNDVKNHLMSIANTNTNTSEHILEEKTPISDQSSLGSCVANSSVDSLEILLGIANKPIEQLSRLFTYWNARLYHKATDVDEGTYIKYAFASLQIHGTCRESTWEYNTNKVFAQPPIKAYREAYENKLTGFFRIEEDGSDRLEKIEAAIRANHPVVFGTPVTKNFTTFFNVSNAAEVSWPIPDSSKSPIVGKHAMVIVGVRNNNGNTEFLIRNSWGTKFGFGGHTWFSADYIGWNGTEDIWVPTIAPDLEF